MEYSLVTKRIAALFISDAQNFKISLLNFKPEDGSITLAK